MDRVFALMSAVVVLELAVPAMAEETGAAEPSVQENIAAMDRDGDGMVTVFELRALIEAKHGKDYQTAVLDQMEAAASGRSCTTPFAGAMLYIP